MENQEVTALMAVDLSAAFDTVDHDVLLKVLQVNFGIDGKALQWFDSYLRPRSCVVNVEDKYSSPRDLSFSVPQGSCAGPILYLAYASTMEKEIDTQIGIHGYADDHAFRKTFKPSDRLNEQSAIGILENTAEVVKSWMDENRLKMNSAKTEFILFGNASQLKKCSTASITVVRDKVDRSRNIKYLGIILYEELNLKRYVMQKCRTAMYGVQRIKSIRSSLTQEAAEVLALGIVMSHLDYANAVFIGLPQVTMRKLQRVQNVAALVVLGRESNGLRSVQCLKRLHWLPINLRVKFKVLVMVFKALHVQSSPEYLRSLLHVNTVSRTLRSNSRYMNLLVPSTKEDNICKSFFQRPGSYLVE